jgi:putative hydrolase of the HAD superfamily
MPQATRCLIFDADDTLWENNIYFEAAIEEFLDLISDCIAPLNRIAPGRREVLDLLNEIESQSIPQRGYGSRHFVNSLRETFRRIFHGTGQGGKNGGGNGEGYLSGIDQIGDRLIHHPIDILPEVSSTLEALRRRYRLMLFTKGDYEEQSSKVARSGLEEHFDRIEIVREKDARAYHELVLRHSLERHSTFMVGNSPRSDVLPALKAGLWAIFVPHAHTWNLEHEDLSPHPRLLTAQSLGELPELLARVFPSQD